MDLRRPKIPRAGPLPQIPGPRGGPAYRPHPRDLPKNDNNRPLRRAYAQAIAVDPESVQPILPLTLASALIILCARVLGVV